MYVLGMAHGYAAFDRSIYDKIECLTRGHSTDACCPRKTSLMSISALSDTSENSFWNLSFEPGQLPRSPQQQSLAPQQPSQPPQPCQLSRNPFSTASQVFWRAGGPPPVYLSSARGRVIGLTQSEYSVSQCRILSRILQKGLRRTTHH